VADRSDSIDVRREKSAEQKSLQAFSSALPDHPIRGRFFIARIPGVSPNRNIQHP